MSWEAATAGRLLDAPAVEQLVGMRVDWTVRPQGAPLPAIVLELITDPRPQTHDGDDSIRWSRVRAKCLAETRAGAIALREAVIAALVPAGEFGGVWFDNSYVDQVRDLGGDTEIGFVHCDGVDLIIWHKG